MCKYMCNTVCTKYVFYGTFSDFYQDAVSYKKAYLVYGYILPAEIPDISAL